MVSSWFRVWTRALTSPSVETFEDFARDPRATATRAYTWMVAASIIGVLIRVLLRNTDITLPFTAIIIVVGYAIGTVITYCIARAFGGTGTYAQLAYAVAAYSAPLNLISIILASIPVCSWLNIAAAIYGVVLSVIAVYAICQFGWGKAIASSLSTLILGTTSVTIALLLLGPIAGEVFKDLVDDISPGAYPSSEPAYPSSERGGTVLPDGCPPDCERANLHGVSLSKANLSTANLSGADLSEADLSQADLSSANLSGANLSKAYLYHTNLSGADLRGTDLSGASLSSTTLLNGANLSGVNLSKLNLSQANLGGANLSGADLREAELPEAHLSNANLSGANLSKAYLGGADLSGADLRETDLSGANLLSALLNGANLSGVNLSKLDLSTANLSDADLSKADLSGADLDGAKLDGAQCTGALYDDRTQWPLAFNLCVAAATFAPSGTPKPPSTRTATPANATTVTTTATPANETAATVTNAPTPPLLEGPGMRILFPLYSYPTWYDAENYIWDDLGVANKQVSITAIINPNNGPGNEGPNDNYRRGLRDLRSSDITILGYVGTSYGERDIADVKEEVDRYDQWFDIDGVFFDEVASGADKLSYYEELNVYVKSQPNLDKVFLNAGTNVDEGYLSRPICDSIVIFEGYSTDWPDYQPAPYVAAYPAERFAVIIHSVSEADTMKSHIDLALARNIGYVYVAEDTMPNPYDTLPSFWEAELDYLASLNAGAR